MKPNRRLLSTFLWLLSVPFLLKGLEECPNITGGEIRRLIPETYITGDNPTPPNVEMLQFRVVCLAVGNIQERYRFVSVVAYYSCSGIPDCDSTFLSQFDFQCVEGNWASNLFGSSSNVRTTPANGSLSTTERRDCAFCVSPNVVTTLPFLGFSSSEVDTPTHCAPCAPACGMVGLGQCTSGSVSDCCSSYDDNGCCEGICGSGEETSTDGSCTCVVVCDGFRSGPDCSGCDFPCGTNMIPNATTCAECICVPGFMGVNCSIDINECDDNPCLNGECSNTRGSYFCSCEAEFTGPNCENALPCQSSPCTNGGTCINNDDGYSCLCMDGYTGENCDFPIIECPPGFTGITCSDDIDECAATEGLCQNGGTCMNTAGSFTCTCADGFRESMCEVNIDDCSPSPCRNGATCVDGVASYTCHCREGWEGPTCETNIDDCASNPCLNDGTCLDEVARFVCLCTSNWEGLTCGDCTIENCVNCKGVPAVCTECREGYELAQQNTTCDSTVTEEATPIPFIWVLAVLSALGALLAVIACLVCVFAIVNLHLMCKKRGSYSIPSGSDISLDELPGGKSETVVPTSTQVPGPSDPIDVTYLTGRTAGSSSLNNNTLALETSFNSIHSYIQPSSPLSSVGTPQHVPVERGAQSYYIQHSTPIAST